MIKTKTFNGSVYGLLQGLSSVFTELGYDDLTTDDNHQYIMFPSSEKQTIKLTYSGPISSGPSISCTRNGSSTNIGTFITGDSSATMHKIYYTSHGIMMTYESGLAVRHSIIIGKLESENENKPYGIIGCKATTIAAYPLSAVGAFDVENQEEFLSYKIVGQESDRIRPTEITGLLPVIVQENGKFFDSIYFNVYTPSPNIVQPQQYEMNGHIYLTDGCYSILDE